MHATNVFIITDCYDRIAKIIMGVIIVSGAFLQSPFTSLYYSLINFFSNRNVLQITPATFERALTVGLVLISFLSVDFDILFSTFNWLMAIVLVSFTPTL